MTLDEMVHIENIAEYAAYLFKYFRKDKAQVLYSDFCAHIQNQWHSLSNHQQRVLWAELEDVYGSYGLNLGNPSPEKPVANDWMDLRTGKITETNTSKVNYATPNFLAMQAILH